MEIRGKKKSTTDYADSHRLKPNEEKNLWKSVEIRGEKKKHHRFLRLTQIKEKNPWEKNTHHRLRRFTQIKIKGEKSL